MSNPTARIISGRPIQGNLSRLPFVNILFHDVNCRLNTLEQLPIASLDLVDTTTSEKLCLLMRFEENTFDPKALDLVSAFLKVRTWIRDALDHLNIEDAKPTMLKHSGTGRYSLSRSISTRPTAASLLQCDLPYSPIKQILESGAFEREVGMHAEQPYGQGLLNDAAATLLSLIAEQHSELQLARGFAIASHENPNHAFEMRADFAGGRVGFRAIPVVSTDTLDFYYPEVLKKRGYMGGQLRVCNEWYNFHCSLTASYSARLYELVSEEALEHAIRTNWDRCIARITPVNSPLEIKWANLNE